MIIHQTAIQVILFGKNFKRRNLMLWTIIVILIILWLLGFLGSNISPSFPRTGGWIHTLIVIAVILIILKLLGIVSF
jgi:lipopolysaccharide export LptBFGC system permease protein LptF